MCVVLQLFLASDRASFTKSAKKSRNNPVSLVQEPSHLCVWQVLPFDPTYRMELECSPVPVSTVDKKWEIKTTGYIFIKL